MVEYKVIDVVRVKDIINHRLLFQLPLSYAQKNGPTIAIVANITQKFDQTIHSKDQILPTNPKLICYLQGGPGFPCEVPLDNSSKTKVLLDKGYTIVYLDQRGTGLSTPIEVGTIGKLAGEREQNESKQDYVNRQLQFILNFRADSIVQDAESIRTSLIGDEKWSLLGQSYGGFCCFSYLSKFPASLREVLVTGGVPPIGFGADDVYQATYERTKERNVHYYDKYPGDVSKVVNICDYLSKHESKLPNGGVLSVERFQQLGISFGGLGGTDGLHQLVFKFDYDLQLFGQPTYSTLNNLQNQTGFDTNIIYALFQEAIYCDGKSQSNWSADRLRYTKGNEDFVFQENSQKIFFTGEMVYKSMWDDYAELKPLKDLALALHENTQWSQLYDAETLSKITFDQVPIVAATYVYDQYVDFDLTRTVKKNVFKGNGNLKQYITSEFFHNGLRSDPEKVIGSLLDLLNCEID